MANDQENKFFEDYASGKMEFGLPQSTWDKARQGAFEDIGRQFSANRYRMSQTAAAAGAPLSGQWVGGMGQLAQGQTREMGRVSNELIMQQQKLALEDRWRALDAAKAKAGLASQERIAQMQNEIQKQLAEIQKRTAMADIHAQATDWTRMLQSEGTPMSDTQMLGWFSGGYDPYSNWY